jgi:hypothetical protein
MEISGEDYASHIAKNLARLHAAWMEEANRETADEFVRLVLETAEREAFELISAAADQTRN